MQYSSFKSSRTGFTTSEEIAEIKSSDWSVCLHNSFHIIIWNEACDKIMSTMLSQQLRHILGVIHLISSLGLLPFAL